MEAVRDVVKGAGHLLEAVDDDDDDKEMKTELVVSIQTSGW